MSQQSHSLQLLLGGYISFSHRPAVHQIVALFSHCGPILLIRHYCSRDVTLVQATFWLDLVNVSKTAFLFFPLLGQALTNQRTTLFYSFCFSLCASLLIISLMLIATAVLC